jgi:hypothetical protein
MSPSVILYRKELRMRPIFRSILAALTILSFAAWFGPLSLHPARAQTGAPQQLTQIALTQKQIDNVLASAKEMDAITQKLPQDAPPDSKTIALLDGVAKKHGFTGYDEYNTVTGNISLVMDGIDPQTKKYIGSSAVLKEQIDQVKADKQMSAADKKQALDQLNMALKAGEPAVQTKGNIDLVIANYDKIDTALGEQQH